jgi:hypothetical protein
MTYIIAEPCISTRSLIAGVLEAVDRWLAACDLPSTRIRIDDHTFLPNRPGLRQG